MASECPKCAKDHARCTFGAGSLGCINDPCKNPHHRPEWVGKTASDVINRPLAAASPLLSETGEEE